MEIEQVSETGGEQGAGGGGEAGGGGAGAPDFDALLGKFEERIGSRFEKLEERLPDREPEGDGEIPEIPDPTDVESFFSDEDYEPDGNLSEAAQERHFWAMVDQRARAIAEDAVAPVQQARAAERRDAEADALEERYVELRDPDVQDRVLDEAVRRAQRLGIPRDQVNAVAGEPAFIELTYLAMKAQEQSDGESAPGAPNVVLESGGAAGPAESADAPDLGDSIVKAAQKGRFRLGQQR